MAAFPIAVEPRVTCDIESWGERHRELMREILSKPVAVAAERVGPS